MMNDWYVVVPAVVLLWGYMARFILTEIADLIEEIRR